eukprot:scaffold265223_cov20-Tisochrysis_lutea.AAC.1
MADMVTKHKPQERDWAFPWHHVLMEHAGRAYKAEIRHHIKYRLPAADLKHTYNSYCRMRQRAHQKQKAQEIVDLIDLRCVDAYKVLRAQKHKHTTPIPADIWTEHLQQHFVLTQEDGYTSDSTRARLPHKHQIPSDQL